MTNINDLLERWAAAEHHGDIEALDTLLADDFQGVGPFGFVLDKGAWIGRYASGDLFNEEFTVTGAQSRAYGPVAVVTAVQEQRAVHQGRAVPGRFRITVVALPGEDRLVNVQLSPIADPAAGAAVRGPAAG